MFRARLGRWFLGGWDSGMKGSLALLLVHLLLFGLRGELFSQDGKLQNERLTRYFEALQQSPANESLFDRFYDAWLEEADSEALAEFFEAKVKEEGASSADRLLFGALLVKQGRDSEALEIFGQASSIDPEDSRAWEELAKVQARLLDFDAAIAAVDRALALELETSAAIELTQLKGSWLNRSGETETALQVWQELAEAYPDDEGLAEDLVELQLDEGLVAEAIATQQELVESSEDPYEKVTRRLRLGDLWLRSADRATALQTYTTCLDETGLGTWLEKEILVRIEQLFRREDDLAGLREHYEEQLKIFGDRLAILERLAAIRAEMGEEEAAIDTYREILQKTPGERGYRERFVDLLGKVGRNAEAASQMEALAANYPEDQELVASLAFWQSRSGQAEAARASIERFLELSDRTEYAYLRAARMLEQFEQIEAADAVFAELIVAFPESISVLEEHAAYLDRSDRKEEAIAIWKEIASEGTSDDAVRSARMLSSRGFRPEAYAILKSRAEEFSGDFQLLGRLCEEAVATGNAKEAIPWMEERLSLAEQANELAEVIRQAIAVLDGAEQTSDYTELLRSKGDQLDLASTCLLSELLERNGEYDVAEEVLSRWIEQGSLLALEQRVRQLESRDDWDGAANLLQEMAKGEKGRSSRNLARLVGALGRALRTEEALIWIARWKQVSPGSSQPWLEEARLLGEGGNTADAIAVLRKTVARFQDEETPQTALADYLQIEGKNSEALEIYRDLYEEAEGLEAKLRWVARLATVAQESGKIEELVEEFDERRRDNSTSLAPLLALAEIYRRTRDSEARREILEEATRLRPEDLRLLQQIARIEEEEGDWEAAIATLESGLPLDKGDDTARRIALLHLRYGDEEVGYRKFAEVRGGEAMDAEAVLGLADAMIVRGGWERAAEFLSEHVERLSADFRVGYLYGVALQENYESERATEVFLSLLDHTEQLPDYAPPLSVSANQVATFWGAVPDGTEQLMDWIQGNWQVFRYLYQLRSGRVQPRAHLSGVGGLIDYPDTVEELHTYVTSQLHRTISFFSDDDERASIVARMNSRGVENASLLAEIPFQENYNPNFIDTSSLIGSHPDNLAMRAAAILTVSSRLSNQFGGAPIPDRDLMLESEAKLRAEYPHLAVVAGLLATLDGDQQVRDEIAVRLATYRELEDPPDLLFHCISMMMQQPAAEAFPEEFKASLVDLFAQWRLSKAQNDTPSNLAVRTTRSRFGPADPQASLLRALEDLEPFADYLDEAIEEYEQERKKMGLTSQSSLGRYLVNVAQRQMLLEPLAFPPLELPDFPPNILLQFGEIPGYGFSTVRTPIDPEAAAGLAESRKHPLVKAIFFHLAGNREAADAAVEALLADSKTNQTRPPLREALFAAGYWQTTERWGKAGETLESIRLLPMSRVLRQRIDRALVVSAQNTGDQSDDIARAVDPESLREWGAAAALRLRYARLSAQHRGELVAVLENLGEEEASKALAELGKTQLASRSGVFVSRTMQSSGAGGVGQQVGRFIEAGKNDQAQDLVQRTLTQAVAPLVGSGTARWDYGLIRLVGELQRTHKKVLRGAFETHRPGQEDAAKKFIEHAAMLELRGDMAEAGTFYEKGLEKMEPALMRRYAARAATVIAATDPAAAHRIFSEYNSQGFAKLGQNLESIQTSMRYNRYTGDRQTDSVTPNLAKFVALVLGSLDEEAGATQRGLGEVVDKVLLPLVYLDDFPDFYGTEFAKNFSNRSPSETLVSRRDEAHRSLHESMLRIPGLADRGFAGLHCLEISKRGQSAFLDEALIELAHEALATIDSQRFGQLPSQQTYFRFLRTDEIPGWYPEEFLVWSLKSGGQPREAAESILEVLRQSKSVEARHRARIMIELSYADASNFSDALEDTLVGPSISASVYSTQHLARATYDQKSRAAKAFHVWLNRREEFGEQLDWIAIWEELVKKGVRQGRGEPALFMTHYTDWLRREKGWPAAEAFLRKATVFWLGDSSRWDRFAKSSGQQIIQGGSSYYRRGEFTEPAHIQYAAFLGACSWNPGLTFRISPFVQRHELDDSYQVSQTTPIVYLNDNNFTRNFSMLKQAFLDGPFTEEMEAFASIVAGDNRDPAMVTILKRIEDVASEEELTDFRQELEQIGSFGSQLSLACLDYIAGDKGKSAIRDTIGDLRAEIEVMDGFARNEVATVMTTIFENGFPTAWGNENPGAAAVVELLGAQRSKSVQEEIDEFLALDSLASLDITSSYELEKRLGQFMNQLLPRGEFESMVSLYWHAMDLIEKDRRKGIW
ncbi:MAG: hypothetical protein AAF236_07800, partial [Verrucomicrobiota bacterium]